MDWFDLFAVQQTLKSLLQHHSSKASILPCSAFFMVQLSHSYMTTGKTIALTMQTFVSKAVSLLLICCLGCLTSLVAQTVKHLPTMQEAWVQSLGWEDPLEKEMATHSSTLAWKISWTEEPGRLQSTGSQRVGHDWVTSLFITRLVIAFLPRSKRLNFITAVSVYSDFGAQENKICHCFHFFPSICQEVMVPDAMIFVFLMLSFKLAFSPSSFTFIKHLFSSSSLSAIRVVSSAYLKLLIFLLAILIPLELHPTRHFTWYPLHIS